ncbi:uracil-DNA glycosylase [Quadrisphaera sp. DSM 44207]|uniref:uracil-DNA glycosylase n=1 Tax=Quadrisphaera sp. DSM 44207 TaxID=1881057 RepID=UPI00088BF258|nr:uracil-DNA glycosylase [Quadrisphaera sp. DSM 44207]SDQ68952.1 uracil-DNA glycosylase, family 4 [Quadrisphaera sp. DSM 44207]
MSPAPDPAPLPHPLTGQPFASPVPPGAGWPEDPSSPRTPRARTPDDVARLAASARTLDVLDARVAVCRACPRLVAWREEVATTKRRTYADQPYWGRPVPGWGDPRGGVLVVGLAPAAHGGNRTGRIFTGDRSGDWVFGALHRAGLAVRAEAVAAGDGQAVAGVRIAAPVRCAPPDNLPAPAERDTCAPWLDREVQLVRPAVLLALGGFAWEQSLACAARLGWAAPRPRPRFAHGAQASLDRPGGPPLHVVASYHVSQQNTFTGRLTEPMLDAVVRRAVELARRADPRPGGGAGTAHQ